MIGLPTPVDDIKSVGFVTGNAIPTLEYLLTGMVVPCRSDRRIVDPLPIGVIAESIRRYLIVCFVGIELKVSMVLRGERGLGGGFEERENEEERGEAEEREEEEGGVGRGRGTGGGGGCVFL